MEVPDSPETREYKLQLDRASAVQRRASILATVVLLALAMAVVGWPNRHNLTSSRTILVLGFCLAALAVGVATGYARQRRAIRSYRLTLWPDRLELTRDGFPDLRISRDEVTQIREVPGSRVVIRTSEKLRTLGIPAYLRDYDDLLARLAKWKEVERATTNPPLLLLNALAMIAAGGGMLVMFYSTNRNIVIPLGIGLLASLAVAAYVFARSPHVDQRTRKTAWIMAFPAVFVVVKIAMMLAS